MTGVQFGQVPVWVYRAGPAAAGLYGFMAGTWGGRRDDPIWAAPETIAEKLGVSLRTFFNWLKKLKNIGAITVTRKRRGDGTLGRASYYLTWEDPQNPRSQPHATYCTAINQTHSACLEVILTDGQGPSARAMSEESDGSIVPRTSKAATTGQMAFDFGHTATDVVDRLDERTLACDTEDRRVSPKGEKGTAASRSVSYWLSGRTQRPPAGVIAGVAKAVKTCFEKNPALSEPAMRDVIDSLMKQGLDASPRQYLVAFGLQGRSRHVRKAGEDLWRHAPKKSSMTPERAAALSPATSTTRNGSSTATVVTPPPVAWPACESTTPASLPSSTTSPTYGETADLDALPAEGLTFDFLNGYAPVAADTTRPARPAWAEQPWVEDPDAPPPANGDPRYASVVPPPEAGYGPHVRIDVLKPSGDANMGDILAGLFSNLGIDLTP